MARFVLSVLFLAEYNYSLSYIVHTVSPSPVYFMVSRLTIITWLQVFMLAQTFVFSYLSDGGFE